MTNRNSFDIKLTLFKRTKGTVAEDPQKNTTELKGFLQHRKILNKYFQQKNVNFLKIQFNRVATFEPR